MLLFILDMSTATEGLVLYSDSQYRAVAFDEFFDCGLALT